MQGPEKEINDVETQTCIAWQNVDSKTFVDHARHAERILCDKQTKTQNLFQMAQFHFPQAGGSLGVVPVDSMEVLDKIEVVAEVKLGTPQGPVLLLVILAILPKIASRN